eukprot:3544368-Pyramimonas_sp.AAC.1
MPPPRQHRSRTLHIRCIECLAFGSLVTAHLQNVSLATELHPSGVSASKLPPEPTNSPPEPTNSPPEPTNSPPEPKNSEIPPGTPSIQRKVFNKYTPSMHHMLRNRAACSFCMTGIHEDVRTLLIRSSLEVKFMMRKFDKRPLVEQYSLVMDTSKRPLHLCIDTNQDTTKLTKVD